MKDWKNQTIEKLEKKVWPELSELDKQDATNGMIFISGYEHQEGKSPDGNGITIMAQRMSGDATAEFDDAAIKPVKKAFGTQKGVEVKKQFQVYYQTELDEPQLLD